MPPEPDPARAPDKVSIIVYSGDFGRVHYALATAAAAAAIDRPATLFFTMAACQALALGADDDTPGWHRLPTETGETARARDAVLVSRGVAGIEDLFEACAGLGVRFLVCEMGLRAIDRDRAGLRDDLGIEEGGLVTFLRDASADGAILFV